MCVSYLKWYGSSWRAVVRWRRSSWNSQRWDWIKFTYSICLSHIQWRIWISQLTSYQIKSIQFCFKISLRTNLVANSFYDSPFFWHLPATSRNFHTTKCLPLATKAIYLSVGMIICMPISHKFPLIRPNWEDVFHGHEHGHQLIWCVVQSTTAALQCWCWGVYDSIYIVRVYGVRNFGNEHNWIRIYSNSK